MPLFSEELAAVLPTDSPEDVFMVAGPASSAEKQSAVFGYVQTLAQRYNVGLWSNDLSIRSNTEEYIRAKWWSLPDPALFVHLRAGDPIYASIRSRIDPATCHGVYALGRWEVGLRIWNRAVWDVGIRKVIVRVSDHRWIDDPIRGRFLVSTNMLDRHTSTGYRIVDMQRVECHCSLCGDWSENVATLELDLVERP